jgi:hypothetical protein
LDIWPCFGVGAGCRLGRHQRLVDGDRRRSAGGVRTLMARERLCKTCRGWHALDAWPEECWQPRNVARADFPTPQISGDSMSPVKSMVDGLHYDSKSALRRTYRDKGYIELGNDHLPERAPQRLPKPERMGKIKTAMEKAGVWDQLRD